MLSEKFCTKANVQISLFRVFAGTSTQRMKALQPVKIIWRELQGKLSKVLDAEEPCLWLEVELLRARKKSPTRFNYDDATYGTAYSSLGLALHAAGDDQVSPVISLFGSFTGFTLVCFEIKEPGSVRPAQLI